MTGEQVNAPRELTQQEMELVSGGAALNEFFDSSGVLVKETGSAFNGHNPGSTNGGHGALNINEHFAKG